MFNFTLRHVEEIYNLVDAISTFVETKICPEDRISEKSRHKFFLVALQTKSEEMLKEVKDEIDRQKLQYPDSDYTDLLNDLDRAEAMYAGQIQGPGSERRNADGNIIDESLLRFDSQDSNVDRAFHFFMKLTDANLRAPTLKAF